MQGLVQSPHKLQIAKIVWDLPIDDNGMVQKPYFIGNGTIVVVRAWGPECPDFRVSENPLGFVREFMDDSPVEAQLPSSFLLSN